MRGQNDVGFGVLAWTGADHVSGFIDVNVFQLKALKELLEFETTLFFMEGRSRNFANTGLLIEHVRFVAFNCLECGFDCWFVHEPCGVLGMRKRSEQGKEGRASNTAGYKRHKDSMQLGICGLSAWALRAKPATA